MIARFDTLRLVVLLGVLLPGAMLPQGTTMHLCLHDLVFAAEVCGACVTPRDGDCCSETEEGAQVTTRGACEACCYELSTSDLEVALTTGQLQGPELAGPPARDAVIRPWPRQQPTTALRPLGRARVVAPLLVPLRI